MKSMLHRVDSNKGENKDDKVNKDEPFFREQILELSSALIGKTDEQMDTITKKANDMNQRLGGGGQKGPIRSAIQKSGKRKNLKKQLEALDYKINQMRMYSKALKTLKPGNDYMYGDCVYKVDLLYKLTDRLYQGTNSQKTHNQIVELLDLLLKEGVVTKDYVKQYHSYVPQ